MIATILIVGAGQLGSRYLQGLVGYSEELNIYVQEKTFNKSMLLLSNIISILNPVSK
mgnify:CR=1 FL=1